MDSALHRFCGNGHLLTWKSQNINKCGMCGTPQTGQSRYKCDTCQVGFCVRCIMPPVFGIVCGGGHEDTRMVLSKVPYHLCDLCGVTIQQNAWRCKICDYDICESCRIEKED